jgi:hypothetical protein
MSDTTAALLQQLLALPADVNRSWRAFINDMWTDSLRSLCLAKTRRLATSHAGDSTMGPRNSIRQHWRDLSVRHLCCVGLVGTQAAKVAVVLSRAEQYVARAIFKVMLRFPVARCGRLVLPNTTALFAACSVAFVPCAIWNMTFLVVAGQNDTIASTPNMWLYIIVWIPLHAAIWSEAQGLSIAVLLASTRVRIPATFVNIFFLGLFPIPTLVNLPGFVLASLRMQDVWDAYSNIAAALKPSIEAWTPGAAFRLEPEWLSLVGAYERAGDRYFPAAAHAGACHLVGQ